MAENALVTLVHELVDFEPPMILLGGLVPDILTRGQQPPVPAHLGTVDVDILLDLQITTDADLKLVEDALLRLGFAPQAPPGAAAWR